MAAPSSSQGKATTLAQEHTVSAPMRPLRIIEMKPRSQSRQAVKRGAPGEYHVAAAAASSSERGRTEDGSPLLQHRDSASGSSVVEASSTGQSLPRKKAHKLIEKRRRSKINDEFAALSSRLPKSLGGSNKLEILQATVRYVDYLEECLDTLKARCDTNRPTQLPPIRHFLDAQPPTLVDGERTEDEGLHARGRGCVGTRRDTKGGKTDL